jgi:apolipoprotein N-acyltransferase
MKQLMEKAIWRWSAACLTGIAIAFVQSLNPLWPIAWLAPIPVLIAVMAARSKREAFALALLAGLIGQVCMAVYYFSGFAQLRVGPGILTFLVAFFTLPGIVPLVAMLFVWRLGTRGVANWLLPFWFPTTAAAVDLLFTTVSPHGTLGSWAYSQMSALPVIQIAALGGTPIVVFVLALFSSTLAVALMFGRNVPRPRLAYGAPIVVLLAALTFGFVRLTNAPSSPVTGVGLAATNVIDAAVSNPNAPEDVAPYLTAAKGMVAGGTDVVVLPEMIVQLDEGAIASAKQRFSGWARESQVWLVVGVDVGNDGHRESRAWVFDRGGTVRADYLKQHLIPLINRNVVAGHDYSVITIDGVKLGVAICKDLDFPSLVRAYAQRGVRALLVPALDLGVDGPWHARMADLRGVEQGISIIRTANEGVMSVSDSYGRIVAREPSGEGSIATLRVAAPLGVGSTLYGSLGDMFGWTCVALTMLTLFWRGLQIRQRSEMGKLH